MKQHVTAWHVTCTCNIAKNLVVVTSSLCKPLSIQYNSHSLWVVLLPFCHSNFWPGRHALEAWQFSVYGAGCCFVLNSLCYNIYPIASGCMCIVRPLFLTLYGPRGHLCPLWRGMRRSTPGQVGQKPNFCTVQPLYNYGIFRWLVV